MRALLIALMLVSVPGGVLAQSVGDWRLCRAVDADHLVIPAYQTRHDGKSAYNSVLAARSARAVDLSLAPNEGVGNAGCPLHPRPRVHVVVVEGTRVTTSTPESPGIPARNGFTTYFALSPVTGLFCHRRPRTNVLPKPGRADITSANLTPASGRQDHTTSPYATLSLVRTPPTAHGKPALRSTIAHPTPPRPPHPTARP
jgi:hypothetical protein